MAYQTLTIWGRDTSEAERAAIRTQAEINVAEGKLSSPDAPGSQADGWTRIWQNEEDAVAWQTFINTFSLPAPTSCTISVI